MYRGAQRDNVLKQVAELPLFLLALGAASVSMYVPAGHALVTDDHSEAQAFFYAGTLGVVLFLLMSVAMLGRQLRHGKLGPLMSLLSIMTVLPVVLALPFYEGLRTTTYFNAYLEMLSAITTTGFPVFDDPERLSSPLHLWRSQVGWMGGFVMWVAAAAILAPLNLGGFEVTARAEPGREEMYGDPRHRTETRMRLFRAIAALFPIYGGLTAMLWVVLLVAGDVPLVALCHAMAVMATSGISPVGGLEGAGSGMTGEALLVLFMVFAISRLTFSADTVTQKGRGLHTDPEFQLAAVIVILVPLLLFFRHWVGAFDIDRQEEVLDAAQALWGSFFTVLSFLTTTGFTSSSWETAQDWSGLGTPGLILMGLSLIGGGVATTAGGVKLLRVFALYRHGVREMERLIHPSSVSGARGMGRRLQRQGAFIAWIFFMLFALSLAVLSLALTALGHSFEDAIILSVAGLSNTGPLITAAGDEPILMAELGIAAKAVLCVAMVVGRLETLAIIALLTPDLWRA